MPNKRQATVADPFPAAADEILRLRDSLRDHRSLSDSFDQMPEIVLILNTERRIVFANTVAQAYASGKGISEIYGMTPEDLFSYVKYTNSRPPCHTYVSAKAILEAMSGECPPDERRFLSGEAYGVETGEYHVVASPFPWEDAILTLYVAEDNSDERRRKVLERIFFHDILNTAGTINGIASLLVSQQVPVDLVKDDLFAASDILITEIRSQRLLIMAENNELIVQMQPMAASEVLTGVVRTFRNHDVAFGKTLASQLEGEDFIFNSDLALISRILGNLVKNALEASGPGESVTLTARKDNADVCFVCHNHKVMPKEVQMQMFMRSFSTKGVGRGIGTYSVKLLAEKYLGGRVSFVSSPEVGTLFKVELRGTAE